MSLIQKIKNSLIAIGIPLGYALIIRLLFGEKWNTWDDFFDVMSVSFLFVLPTIVGVLTVYLSSYEKAKNRYYQIVAPWLVLLLFILITLLTGIEGWACWLMIMPVFMVASSIGGIFGGYLKKQKEARYLKVSLLILIPFLSAPIEHSIDKIPAKYQAYTYIDIEAPAEHIWDQVTRVGEISPEDDKGYLTRLLGFPRPLKAELNYEGVGAYRYGGKGGAHAAFRVVQHLLQVTLDCIDAVLHGQLSKTSLAHVVGGELG